MMNRTISPEGRTGWLSILPATLWEFVFLVVPLTAIVVISFLSRGEYGAFELPWTLENYKRLLGFGAFGFDLLYPLIILRSLILAVITAFLCATAALPLAFFVARCGGRTRIVALILLTAPIWTNLLVRTYAWQHLLGPNSFIVQGLVVFGLIGSGQGLYPGMVPVLLALICDFLPFAALPVYVSVEKLDYALLEAAQDLGASRAQIFRHAIYPQISPGLWTGFLLVLLPAIGQFVIPDLLGGAKVVLIGNILQQQFGASRDWPFGAAFATIILIVAGAGMVLYFRKVRREAL